MLLTAASRFWLILLASLTHGLTLRLRWLISARPFLFVTHRFRPRRGLQLQLIRDELIHIARLRTDF